MNLNLNNKQLKKIALAHNEKTNVIVQLTFSQIGKGKYFDLPDRQIKKLEKAKQDKKGVRLELNYDQIKKGGFIPLIIAGIGAASALAGGASAIVNSVVEAKHKKAMERETTRHNKEMEKIVSKTKTIQIGSGLKKKNNKTLNL